MSPSSPPPSSLHAARVFVACFILATCMPSCCGSAIPIWEFLSRNEKMSYLYSTFAQLVSIHCKATFTASTSAPPVNQCKHNLLAYGYDKLQTFSDQQLDTFDPYQRGASELIWSSIMRDHPSARLITTRKPVPTPPLSSIIILTHQQNTINKASQQDQQLQQQQQQTSTAFSDASIMPLSVSATNTNHNPPHDHQFGKNPMFEDDKEHLHQYSMDMDAAYGYPALNHQQKIIDKLTQEQQQQLEKQQEQQQQQKQHHQQQESTFAQHQHHHHHHDYLYGKNPMFETDAEHLHKYAMDMDAAYGYAATLPFFTPKQTQQVSTNMQQQQQQQPTFLTGPLVIRVRPDGTPVEEDQHKPLPRDDDLDEYHVTSESLNSNNNNNNNDSSNNKLSQPNKHHKIATISALKQQQLAALTLQQQQQQPKLQSLLQQHQQQQPQEPRRHQYEIPVSQSAVALLNDYRVSTQK